MKDSIHVSKENYLKAILEAEAEGHQVIPATLAHWLEVSAPAVTMALKRLKRDGYVEVGSDGIVRLTALGRETAYQTALRHHLIERMLSEIFGMEWYEIHEEAERLEHAVSPAFEAKLKDKLGEAGSCPHGNAVLPVRHYDALPPLISLQQQLPVVCYFGTAPSIHVADRSLCETTRLPPWIKATAYPGGHDFGGVFQPVATQMLHDIAPLMPSCHG